MKRPIFLLSDKMWIHSHIICFTQLNSHSINKLCIMFVHNLICKFYEIVIGTGGQTFVTEGKDALLTCVIMGSFLNDTVLWRRGNNEILAAGTNRVTSDKRFRVLHDESKLGDRQSQCFIYVIVIL